MLSLTFLAFQGCRPADVHTSHPGDPPEADTGGHLGGPDPDPGGVSLDGGPLLPGPGVSVVDVTAHTADFSLDAWDGAVVTLTCRGGGDEHVHEATASVGEPVRLRGLLAEESYRCTCSDSAGRVSSFTVETAAEDHPLPAVEITGDPEEIGNGYLLFNVFLNGLDAEDQQIVIVDAEGRLRWSSWIGTGYAGDVDTSWPGDGAVLFGGGYGVTPTRMSLDGDVLWQAPDAPTDHSYHHQARAFSDGSVVTLTLSDDTLDGEDYLGHWVGAWSPEGELLWDWHTNQGVAQGVLTPDLSLSDPFHANAAVEVDFDECDVLVSMRNVDTLACVDHATGTIAWTLADDFTLVDDDGSPVETQWTDGQHDPEPDGNRLLVFDNGRDRTGDVRTRVVEYELSPETRTARQLWTYHEDGWDESVWGGARRFGDDHVLIALPHCMGCSSDAGDVARSALIALDSTREQVWRLQFVDEAVGLYRGQVIDPCAIFENRRYCTE